jgi:hypothetical protein
VPEKLKRDIEFAHANVKRFAEAQKATVANFEVEIVPGLIAGQKSIPVDAAGCYVPGGRYSHIASAIMTVTTAKVAGLRQHRGLFTAAPRRRASRPAIIYAADICGADKILAMGGVQGVAAMAFGLFGLPKANSRRPRQPVRGRGQAHALRPRRHRHVRRPDRQPDPRRQDGGSGDGRHRPRGSGRAWLQLAGLAGDGFTGAGREVMEMVPRLIDDPAGGEPRERRPPPGAIMPR